jgi:hypothetical protein
MACAHKVFCFSVSALLLSLSRFVAFLAAKSDCFSFLAQLVESERALGGGACIVFEFLFLSFNHGNEGVLSSNLNLVFVIHFCCCLFVVGISFLEALGVAGVVVAVCV